MSICHEDADAIAFMDIQPVNNGHVLVVPREHYESLLDVPQEIGMHLFQVTMRIANAVRTVTGCDDMNIVVNSGKAAGQDEPHYHVHIIPRREGDGFDIPLPFNGSEMPDRTLLDAYAARVGAALRDPMRAAKSGSSSGEGRQTTEASTASDSGAGEAATGASAAGARRATAPRMKAITRGEERVVALPTFDEAEEPVLADAPVASRKAGQWWMEEGPHGELRYEEQAEVRDAQ